MARFYDPKYSIASLKHGFGLGYDFGFEFGFEFGLGFRLGYEFGFEFGLGLDFKPKGNPNLS